MSEQKSPIVVEQTNPKETLGAGANDSWMPDLGISDALSSAASEITKQSECALETYSRFHTCAATSYTGNQHSFIFKVIRASWEAPIERQQN